MSPYLELTEFAEIVNYSYTFCPTTKRPFFYLIFSGRLMLVDLFRMDFSANSTWIPMLLVYTGGFLGYSMSVLLRLREHLLITMIIL